MAHDYSDMTREELIAQLEGLDRAAVERAAAVAKLRKQALLRRSQLSEQIVANALERLGIRS